MVKPSSSVRRTSYAIAKLQARDIERVVGRSDQLASKLWRIAKDMAASPIKKPSPELVNQATNELALIMAYAYLIRIKVGNRRRKMAKSLVLASVLEEAKKIADKFDLDLGNVKKRFVSTSGKAIKKSVSDIRSVMNSALAKATQSDVPTYAAVEQVISAVRLHGIEPRSTGYVETLVRTHAAIAYGVAHRVSFEGDVDLWGFEYLTVGDDRVRPEHEALDGIKRKKDDEFWDTYWPPNGWNCRCQAVAIYDSEEKQTPVPKGAEADEGFDTDFTEILF